MKEFLLQTYTIALPILLGYIVWLLKKQKKDRDANSRGTMLLLRVQMIEYHDKYCALGSIPSYAYNNFDEMYQAYHELGGNGMIEKMKQESKKNGTVGCVVLDKLGNLTAGTSTGGMFG